MLPCHIWQAPLRSMTDNNNVALPYMASTINNVALPYMASTINNVALPYMASTINNKYDG